MIIRIISHPVTLHQMLSSHDRTDENGPTPAVSPSKKLSTFTAQDSVSIEWAVDTAASVSNDPVTALLADLKKVEVESLDSPQSSMTSLSGVYKVDTLVGLTNEGVMLFIPIYIIVYNTNCIIVFLLATA